MSLTNGFSLKGMNSCIYIKVHDKFIEREDRTGRAHAFQLTKKLMMVILDVLAPFSTLARILLHCLTCLQDCSY